MKPNIFFLSRFQNQRGNSFYRQKKNILKTTFVTVIFPNFKIIFSYGFKLESLKQQKRLYKIQNRVGVTKT